MTVKLFFFCHNSEKCRFGTKTQLNYTNATLFYLEIQFLSFFFDVDVGHVRRFVELLGVVVGDDLPLGIQQVPLPIPALAEYYLTRRR